MKYLTILTISFVVLIGCKQHTEQTENTVTQNPKIVQTEAVPNTLPKDTIAIKTHNLLQGEWMNIDDNASTIIFKGNQSINTYNGLENDTTIYFTVGNSCENNTTPKGVEKKDMFISTTGDSQECYYILTLNDTNLVLNYINGGFSLRFKRI